MCPYTHLAHFFFCALLYRGLSQGWCVFVNNDLPFDDFYQPGDILLGGMLPLWRSAPGLQCKANFVPAYIQCAHAFKYVIDEVNNRSDLLPNVTLGFAIVNDCARSAVGVARATQFLPVESCAAVCHQNSSRPSYAVVGVVGPVTSDWNIAVANILGPYHIPQIGWIATGNELSSKVEYEYFSRTVPPDMYQAQALIAIVDYFEWTYIATLSAESGYGRDGIKHVVSAAKKIGVCIAFSKELHPEAGDEDFDVTVKELAAVKNLKIIIVYLYWTQNRRLLQALKKASLGCRFVIVSAETMTPDAYSGLEEVALGTFSTHPKGGSVSGFEEYYKSLPIWRNESLNPWLGQYTPEIAGCSFSNDTSMPPCQQYKSLDDFPDFYWTTYYPLIMDATMTFVQALHAYVEAECKAVSRNTIRDCIKGPKLLHYIRNTSFKGYVQDIKFDENGDLIGGYDIRYMMKTRSNKVENVLVGLWNRMTGKAIINRDLPWYVTDEDCSDDLDTGGVPDGTCAAPCGTGEYYVRETLACCWQCRKCAEYEFVREDLSGCARCPEMTWPDQHNFTKCESILPDYLTWDEPVAIAIETLTVVGTAVATLTTFTFIYHWKHIVVRGSSRDLMIPIIFGIYFSFGTVFLFLAKPTTYSCLFSFCGFHLSCTFIFGPLFLKTLRVYRIFEASQRGNMSLYGISQRFQLLATTAIGLCQIFILITLGFIDSPKEDLEMPFVNKKYVTLQCNLPTLQLLIPLSFNLALLFACAVFGFLTRQLPENFQESWYIFVAVVTNICIWVAFIPIYFLAMYSYHQAALLSFAVILNAGVTTLCLFAPKAYAIYFIEENKIKISTFKP